MTRFTSYRLTIQDHAALERVLLHCREPHSTFAVLLREKLAAAAIVADTSIPPTTVTLDSRVSYRIGDRPVETRIVSLRDAHGAVGAVLPATTIQGLALVGLREGEDVEIVSHGIAQRLSIIRVHYQPEAAIRDASNRQAEARPRLRLVHSVDRLTSTAAFVQPHDHDDPGPSAA